MISLIAALTSRGGTPSTCILLCIVFDDELCEKIRIILEKCVKVKYLLNL